MHNSYTHALASSASLIGSELSSLLGSDPSLCPAPIRHAATKTTRVGISFGVSRPTTESKPFRGYHVFSSREHADRFVQRQWQTLSQDLLEQTVANIRQIRRDEIPAEHYVSLDENIPVTWAALLAGG